MKFPNLVWAIDKVRLANYEAAAQANMSESRFSRCLSGRTEFSSDERKKLSKCLGYPGDWLFREVTPPAHVKGVGEEIEYRLQEAVG